MGFGISESIVERSLAKAMLRGVLALPLGVILGFIFELVANLIYNLGLGICAQMGVVSYRNPAAWIARGIAWTVFGAAGGTIYGIVGQSMKKAKYGIIGGLLGAGLGGTIFDPIRPWPPRAVRPAARSASRWSASPPASRWAWWKAR